MSDLVTKRGGTHWIYHVANGIMLTVPSPLYLHMSYMAVNISLHKMKKVAYTIASSTGWKTQCNTGPEAITE